jgi:hypothetical protein
MYGLLCRTGGVNPLLFPLRCSSLPCQNQIQGGGKEEKEGGDDGGGEGREAPFIMVYFTVTLPLAPIHPLTHDRQASLTHACTTDGKHEGARVIGTQDECGQVVEWGTLTIFLCFCFYSLLLRLCESASSWSCQRHTNIELQKGAKRAPRIKNGISGRDC